MNREAVKMNFISELLSMLLYAVIVGLLCYKDIYDWLYSVVIVGLFVGLFFYNDIYDIYERRKEEKLRKVRKELSKLLYELNDIQKRKRRENRKKKREKDTAYKNLQSKKASEKQMVRHSIIFEESSKEEQLLFEWKVYNDALEMQKTCKRCQKGTCNKRHAMVCKPRNLKK